MTTRQFFKCYYKLNLKMAMLTFVNDIILIFKIIYDVISFIYYIFFIFIAFNYFP